MTAMIGWTAFTVDRSADAEPKVDWLGFTQQTERHLSKKIILRPTNDMLP
jgi:hypothetical protein